MGTIARSKAKEACKEASETSKNVVRRRRGSACAFCRRIKKKCTHDNGTTITVRNQATPAMAPPKKTRSGDNRRDNDIVKSSRMKVKSSASTSSSIPADIEAGDSNKHKADRRNLEQILAKLKAVKRPSYDSHPAFFRLSSHIATRQRGMPQPTENRSRSGARSSKRVSRENRPVKAEALKDVIKDMDEATVGLKESIRELHRKGEQWRHTWERREKEK